jgi:hypothetical protein
MRLLKILHEATKPKWKPPLYPNPRKTPSPEEGESKEDFIKRYREIKNFPNTSPGITENWQRHSDPRVRELIPPQERNILLRGLSKLTAATPVRQRSDGGHEFLLCRSLFNSPYEDNDEFQQRVLNNNVYVHEYTTSWSPLVNWNRALAEGKLHREMVIQAWIPEEMIISIPKQFGFIPDPNPGLFNRDIIEEEKQGPNKYAKMFEVLVRGGANLKIEKVFDKFYRSNWISSEELENSWSHDIYKKGL